MKYHQLTLDERYQIQAYLHIGKSVDEIALLVNRHRSTIFREIKRHTWRNGYRARPAQRVSDYTRKMLRFSYKLDPLTIYLIKWGLKNGFSPEQIARRLWREQRISISHETIYRYIWWNKKEGGELYKSLRNWRRKRRRFPRELRMRSNISDRKPISERPKSVEQRSQLGHWERDLMLGSNRKKAILALVERKSRYVLLRKLERKTAKCTKTSTIRALSGKKLLTLTNDNGSEFAQHKAESIKLGVPIFFTNPYTASERGTCENTIGLVRQYLPKKFDIDGTSHESLRTVEKMLNDRPRKCLNFRTPNEVFYGIDQKLFPDPLSQL